MTTAADHYSMAAPPAAERFPSHVLPAVIVVYACMLPRELTFEIAGVAFQPFRVALVLTLPFVVMQLVRQRLSPSIIDALIFFASLWMVLAYSVTESFAIALASGLADSLNLLLCYIVGRASIRTSGDFRSFFLAVLPGLILCGLIIAVESISHNLFLRPFVGSLLGYSDSYFVEVRWGLMRGLGPFPHPIGAGVFMASFLPITWYVAKKPLPFVLGLLAAGTFFFTLSSTSFVAAIVGAGLIFACFLQRVTQLPVFLAITVAAIFAAIGISLLSEGGVFSFIVRRLTLDPATGWYRIAIWEYAGAEINRHPIFGIGMRDYTRPGWMVPSSVDAHWLVLPLRYGYPVLVGVLAATIGAAALALSGTRSPYPNDKAAAYAIGFSLIAFMWAGMSVYFWEGPAAWLTILTGMGVTFGKQVSRARLAAPNPVANPDAVANAGLGTAARSF